MVITLFLYPVWRIRQDCTHNHVLKLVVIELKVPGFIAVIKPQYTDTDPEIS